MKRKLLYLSFPLLALAGCQKDNSLANQKLMNYALLCPAGGINVCYDNCGTENGIGAGPTGSQMASYESCKSNCDSYCNIAQVLLFLEK